jgi:ABC-type phosphate/phosphonate transport system substrate-binding protein
MYDWPEVAWATDALWSAIAERLNAAGIEAPGSLDRSRDAEAVWRDPGLVLSQTCGYPYAMRLQNAVRLVATPVYGVAGCEGPLYSSFIVARREDEGRALADFAGRSIAFNARDSLSGYLALVAAMKEQGMDPGVFEWIETGSHRASVGAVAHNLADLAAIDAVCWALSVQYDARAAALLRPVMWTKLRPALPFITAGGRDAMEVADIYAALLDALSSSETANACAALGIAGVAVTTAADYAPLARLVD